MVIDLSAIMKTILGINWRTTAAAIAPAVTSLGLIDKAIGDGQWPNSTDMAVIASFISMAWGLLMAKDRVVTGGSVSNVDGSSAGATVSAIHGGEVVDRALGPKP